ncbi:M23 family metallopeptidase [Microbacterium sp. PM5]|uniref:M23 family metallopeptidase n=1 Tax=Microbacterium sp. PM5 TaxID=2014534 RepID=UPI000DD15E11|nr:M23 family metallopeptidase [Microbacterium sp. PM5]AXA95470.1 hypothetical protein CEP17_03005 [Microbacterium sp. PM5]
MSAPQNVLDFYAERYWSLPFGAQGDAYTIVPGRHIGMDILAGNGEDIPTLWPGRVAALVLTGTMAWVVVVLGTDGNYYFYCHIANDHLPTVGSELAQGERVGRAANGPKTLPAISPDFPGSAWTGRHLHLVVTTNPTAAYSFVPGYRTLDAFTDPAIIIRSVLAGTSADTSRPFTPQIQPEPEPTGVLPMPNISIIYNLDAPGQKQQVAIGPRGRVALNGQTADLLNRWMRWQIAGGDVSKAGGMSVAEMDLLISGVLSKIS